MRVSHQRSLLIRRPTEFTVNTNLHSTGARCRINTTRVLLIRRMRGTEKPLTLSAAAELLHITYLYFMIYEIFLIHHISIFSL